MTNPGRADRYPTVTLMHLFCNLRDLLLSSGVDAGGLNRGQKVLLLVEETVHLYDACR